MSTSNPGKHGHAKINIEGYDIFTHQKLVDSGPAHHNVDVPVIKKMEYQLLNIDREDGFLGLFDRVSGEVKDDVRMLGDGEMRE